jgi:RES domain
LADQSDDSQSHDRDIYDKIFERILTNEGDLARTAESTGTAEFTPLLCSNCFADYGLTFDATSIGVKQGGPCPHCGSTNGRKLDKSHLLALADTFFVRGTLIRPEYGGAPILQFNEHHHGKTDINVDERLRKDAELLGDAAGIGFFHYGPRLWMLGEVEPLKALQDKATRDDVIKRILAEYPERVISVDERVVRIRKGPKNPSAANEYDSPPPGCRGGGRLDSEDFPVLYASQDIEVCVHECKVTVEDDLYMATIAPTLPIRCLDLTAVLEEDGVTEFESLDMAVHMLFLARPHSYDICRAIAIAAKEAGFAGLIYPSYFSLVRTGARPFDTAYGLSVRRFPSHREHARALSIPNVALFGEPIREGYVRVDGVNRVLLQRVGYDVHFGPVGL